MSLSWDIDDDELYCYLPGSELRRLLKDERVLDALAEELGIIAKPAAWHALTLEDKLADIEGMARYQRGAKSSPWYGASLPEIVAANIFMAASLPDHTVLVDLYCDLKRESDLAGPVGKWLRKKGFSVSREIPLGKSRADLLGYKKEGFLTGAEVVAIELKNDIAELKRGLDQMATYSDYAHYVYLACTPSLAAEYLRDYLAAPNVLRWDPQALNARLKKFGFGLLLVEHDGVYEHIQPREFSPAQPKIDELKVALK